MSRVIDICDAVTAHLNSLGYEWTAERSAAAFLQRENLTDGFPTVLVTPTSFSRTIESRCTNTDVYSATVHFIQSLPADFEADVETLLDLLEVLANEFDRKEMSNARWIGVSQDPLYDEELLHESNIFYGQLVLSYQD